MVQSLKPHAPNAGGMDSIPGWRTKIPHTKLCSPKAKGQNYSDEKVWFSVVTRGYGLGEDL